MTVDSIDRRILRALQTDSRQTVAEIGVVAGLSPSACHRRIRNLEQAGVISGYTARLDRRALGYAMEFFVQVELRSQSDKALEAFERAVETAPEILECHLMAGSTSMRRTSSASIANGWRGFRMSRGCTAISPSAQSGHGRVIHRARRERQGARSVLEVDGVVREQMGGHRSSAKDRSCSQKESCPAQIVGEAPTSETAIPVV